MTLDRWKNEKVKRDVGQSPVRNFRYQILFLFSIVPIFPFAQSFFYDTRINISDRFVGWTFGIEGRAIFGKHQAGINLNYLAFNGSSNVSNLFFRDAAHVGKFCEGLGSSLSYSVRIFKSQHSGTEVFLGYDCHFSNYSYMPVFVDPFAYIANGADTFLVYTKGNGYFPGRFAIMNGVRMEFDFQISNRIFLFGNCGGGIAFFERGNIFPFSRIPLIYEFVGPLVDFGLGYKFGLKKM